MMDLSKQYAVILEPGIHIYMHFNSHSIHFMQILIQMPGADPTLFVWRGQGH